MNTIKLIIIIGLVYISLNQKKDSTRNMMLLMTGLLAFCIFGRVEGYCAIAKSAFLSDEDIILKIENSKVKDVEEEDERCISAPNPYITGDDGSPQNWLPPPGSDWDCGCRLASDSEKANAGKIKMDGGQCVYENEPEQSWMTEIPAGAIGLDKITIGAICQNNCIYK